MHRHVTWSGSLLMLANAGCTAVTSTEEFTELSLEVEMERLEPGCGACMATRCAAFDACASVAACVDYAACRAADRSPAGYAACGDERDDFARLLECDACADACRLGTNWDCIANYVWPRVEEPIRFRQRLLDNPIAGPEIGLKDVHVQVCNRADLDCISEPERGGKTDRKGWVQLELPNAEDQRGFDGYLLASGSSVPTLRVHRTIRLRSGRLQTELFTNRSLGTIISSSTVGLQIPAIDLAKPQLVFQVLDCLHQPAVGVSVELKEVAEPDRVVLYNDDVGGRGVNLGGTTRLGKGTGAMINLSMPSDDDAALRRFEFGRADQVLGHTAVTVHRGHLTVALMEPSDGR